MDFISWMAVGLGGLMAGLALLALVLTVLAEMNRPAADRNWREALAQYAEGFQTALVGGLVLVAFGLLLHDPNHWFGIVFTPLAVIGAMACIAVLVGDAAAAKEDRPEEERESWRAWSHSWGKRGSWAASMAIALSCFYWFIHVNGKLDDLALKMKALEERVGQVSKSLPQ